MRFSEFNLRVLIIGLSIMMIVACKQHAEDSLPGYVEGKYTYISCNYSGVLKTLNVEKGEEVKAGQLLFTLVPEPESDEVLAAQDRVKQALALQQQSQADLDLQKSILDRRQKLQKQKFITQEELEISTAKANEAYANFLAQKDSLATAQADLRKAEWAAKQKITYSPISGLVFDTFFYPGELVDSTTPVVSLLDTNRVKIYFYSPETMLSQFKLNQIIEVSCDGCSTSVKAKISYISPSAEFTPPVIYSNEVRKKLVYRIEAQPLIDKAYLVLHPGQPIVVHRITEN